MKILFLILLFCSLPLLAFADAGGPLLFLLNSYLFTIGQVWIILSEYTFLHYRLPSVRNGRLLFRIIYMNFITTIIGALLIPLLLSLGFMYLGLSVDNSNPILSGILFALGTWVWGDHTPNIGIVYGSAGVIFIGTFFLTVWLEYKLMKLWSKGDIFPREKRYLSLSYQVNLISYFGLIVLILFGTINS